MPVEDLNCSVFEKHDEKSILFLRERGSEDCPGTSVEKNSHYKMERPTFTAVCIS